MQKKLTKEQIYNHQYYLAHKNDAKYKARRAIIEKKYRSKAAVKRKRNAKLRNRWATDAAFRKHICEYQKMWRKRKKIAANQAQKKSITNHRGKNHNAG